MKNWLLVLLFLFGGMGSVANAALSEVVEGSTRYVLNPPTVRMKLGDVQRVGEDCVYERKNRFFRKEICTWSKTITGTPSGVVATKGGTSVKESVLRPEILFSVSALLLMMVGVLWYRFTDRSFGSIVFSAISTAATAALLVWVNDVLIGWLLALPLVLAMMASAFVTLVACWTNHDKYLYSAASLHISLMGVYIWLL
jgi:hypothetical protein